MEKRLKEIKDRVAEHSRRIYFGQTLYKDIPDRELLSLINHLDPVTHSMGMSEAFTNDIIVQFLIEFTEIGLCAKQTAETLNKIMKKL